MILGVNQGEFLLGRAVLQQQWSGAEITVHIDPFVFVGAVDYGRLAPKSDIEDVVELPPLLESKKCLIDHLNRDTRHQA